MPPLPFHPLINAWFAETYEKPTPVQAAAWPLIANGGHVLALAPTGSGKTLTALGSKRGYFLSCQIDRLALVAGEFQRVALSATVKPL